MLINPKAGQGDSNEFESQAIELPQAGRPGAEPCEQPGISINLSEMALIGQWFL